MEQINTLIRALYTSKLHIALSGTLLTAFYFQGMDLPVDFAYLLVTGVSILMVYRYAGSIAEVLPEIGFIKVIRRMPFMTISLIMWLLFMTIYQSVSVVIIALVSIWLTASYFVKFPPFTRVLAKNHITKPLVTSLVFSLLTTSVPLLTANLYSFMEIFRVTVSNFFFITSIALVFDIFEMYTSKEANSLTRVRSYKWIACGLLIIAGIINLFTASSFTMSIHSFVALGITYGITMILIIFAAPQRNTITYHVLADSTMAMPWIIWQWMNN